MTLVMLESDASLARQCGEFSGSGGIVGDDFNLGVIAKRTCGAKRRPRTAHAARVDDGHFLSRS
jgi:hypothetical protein